jgi:hypothetical protein
MAYQNFIPTIWSEAINRELERNYVFAVDCNRQYEGDVKQAGDTVRVLGVGKPTITTTTDKNIAFGPEVVADTSVSLIINQIAYFNYKVDDIDKRQAVGGVMDALSKEASEGLANAEDQSIANLALSQDAVLDHAAAIKVEKANILSTIDAAVQKLYENDVSP